ncbi:MAG: ATP-binding cassette domain-containing protein, partial [Candidatus Moranbacteria bacterium]|nr:ATP-binding cassette domain-containing protein [Candidatus Moranbacteria bacterium]
MLIAKDLSIGYGGNSILDGINFALEMGEKVALIGPNGSGKSTLLKTLAGKLKLDAGFITMERGARIGYLPQIVEIISEETVPAYIKRVAGIRKIEKQLELLEKKIEDPLTLKEYGEVQERFIAIDGYTFERRMKIILQGFGLDQSISKNKISDLSGGQKSKIAIASLLLSKPEIFLLDEPTN